MSARVAVPISLVAFRPFDRSIAEVIFIKAEVLVEMKGVCVLVCVCVSVLRGSLSRCS